MSRDEWINNFNLWVDGQFSFSPVRTWEQGLLNTFAFSRNFYLLSTY
jgi:hypothetical protein